ncbi:MAG: hypothetical protein AAFP04_13340 [Myxococcota bacterium]
MRTFYLILFAIVITLSLPQAPAAAGTERDFGLYLTDEGEAVPSPVVKTEAREVLRGFVGWVDVIQIFANPFAETIEATYVFPLPEGVSQVAPGELSRRLIPPGDPVISVAPPADAERATAEDFEAFFAGGADCLAPSALRSVNAVANTMLELNVDTIEPATEVYAHSPELGWDRIALQPIDDERVLWDALMVVDSDVAPGAYEVLVVVRDAAGNRLTQTLEVLVLGRSGDLESVSALNGEVLR